MNRTTIRTGAMTLALLLTAACGSSRDSSTDAPRELATPTTCTQAGLSAGRGGDGGELRVVAARALDLSPRVTLDGGKSGAAKRSLDPGHDGRFDRQFVEWWTFRGVRADEASLDLEVSATGAIKGNVAPSPLLFLRRLHVASGGRLLLRGIQTLYVRELVIEPGAVLALEDASSASFDTAPPSKPASGSLHAQIKAGSVRISGTLDLHGANGRDDHRDGFHGGSLELWAETIAIDNHAHVDLRGGDGVDEGPERPCP